MTAIFTTTYLVETSILPKEQRALRGKVRGTADCLLTDAIVRGRTRSKSHALGTCWINFKKAFHRVPHTWLMDAVGAPNLPGWFTVTLLTIQAQWGTWYHLQTPAGASISSRVEYKWGLLQGNSLSPILFCLTMAPISWARKRLKPYVLKNGTPVSHTFFVGDLKIYSPGNDALRTATTTAACVSVAVRIGVRTVEVCNGLNERRYTATWCSHHGHEASGSGAW